MAFDEMSSICQVFKCSESIMIHRIDQSSIPTGLYALHNLIRISETAKYHVLSRSRLRGYAIYRASTPMSLYTFNRYPDLLFNTNRPVLCSDVVGLNLSREVETVTNTKGTKYRKPKITHWTKTRTAPLLNSTFGRGDDDHDCERRSRDFS
jgi:hypothetical protein